VPDESCLAEALSKKKVLYARVSAPGAVDDALRCLLVSTSPSFFFSGHV
jgi:hypothetical protein